MKVVIDTSSLLSLVRYYLPFDKSRILYNFIESKIESKEILILDKVYNECKYVSKEIIVKTLPYITNRKNQINTTDLLPNEIFFNKLENEFINDSVKNKIKGVEFENRKNVYMNSADPKLLLYCLQNKNDDVVIVSEETDSSNDNKLFKKLPAICKILDITIITLPKLLDQYDGINLEFK
ncbi:MAG: DUF4411 family protein [Ignavibacteriales bacterium]|nr:DUF4411 family protein [Ignavibacteriales bacterium]